jgi:hypothetical protein
MNAGVLLVPFAPDCRIRPERGIRPGVDKEDSPMGYVDPDKPDVFFSYARVDDNPIPGSNLGWVSNFYQRLRWEIDRKLGRNDACQLWMDSELPANAMLDEALPERVRSTAVMVLFLSRGYNESKWCQGEMLEFLKVELQRRGTGPTSGLFVVELDNEERPAPLKKLNLVGKQFYQADTRTKRVRTEGRVLADWQEPVFYDKVIDVAQEIAAELERRKAAAAGGDGVIPVPAVGQADGPKVFLAEVPDGQEHMRNDIKNYLAMEGYSVVPARRYPTDDPEPFEKAVRADLAGAKVFAQLLGKSHGALLEGTDKRRLVVQYDLAREYAQKNQLLIVSGRRRTLDPEKLAMPNPDPEDVIDPAYLALLRHPLIMPFDTIEDFKRAIVNRVKEALKPPMPVVVPRAGSALVLVHADRADELLAEQIKKALRRRAVTPIHPVAAGDMKTIRKSLESKLEQCDGVMLMFGSADLTWVDTQLLQAHKILGQRDRPPRVVSVYEGPPRHDVEDLGYDPVEFAFLFQRLPDNGDDRRLDEFINALAKSEVAV